MKKILIASLFIIVQNASAQVNPKNISIARDKWGVPHIFGKTDAEVAYGLAWAHAEDNFKCIQENFLASKGFAGRYYGAKGAAADYAVQLLRARSTVESKVGTISPAFKTVIQGYLAGLNKYAELHPKECLFKKDFFPITEVDYYSTSMLSLALFNGVDRTLTALINGTQPVIDMADGRGSNAFAMNSTKTKDGSTMLNINAHQPLDGGFAWYEAHLSSEEGWNCIGGLFPGSATVLLGANAHLAWAHTVNFPDLIDVFQLKINPANLNQYEFDGQWIDLETDKAKLKVKLPTGLILNAKKEILWSKYGATLRTKNGTFSIRLGATMDIRAVEQWYNMNKAKDLPEFKKAMSMTAITFFNTIYADDKDNIYYISNGKIPIRAAGYNWKYTVPGNTSKTLWTDFHAYTDLPQYTNPACGYLYNTNHSPFKAAADIENLTYNNFDTTMGFEQWDVNRSVRFRELISTYNKVSWEDFKTIKFDRTYPKDHFYFFNNIDSLFLLNPDNHKDISDMIKALNTWDRKADTLSTSSTIYAVAYYFLVEKFKQKPTVIGNILTEAEAVEALKYTQKHLLKYFGSNSVPLGNYQRLVHGSVEYPLGNLPDNIASMSSITYKNGRVKGSVGDSYIALVQYKNGKPLIETIHSYGASNHEDSKHFADQMPLFNQQKTKTMSIDKAEILKTAERVYCPE